MPSANRYWGSIPRSKMEKFVVKHPGVDFNLFCKQVIEGAIDGTVNDSSVTDDTKKELERIKIQNARRDGALKDLQIWKLAKESNLYLTLQHLDGISTGKVKIALSNDDVTIQTPQKTETKHEEHSKNFTNTANSISLSIWDEAENQFICNDCNPQCKFEYRLGVITEMMNIVSEFQNHVINTHGRSLNEKEKKIIDEYLNFVNNNFVKNESVMKALSEVSKNVC